MKKLITLFITCLLGTVATWAETGDITSLPYTLTYEEGSATTPFDLGTVTKGTNIVGFFPGRNNTATAYFDTDDVEGERTPYTLSANETVTISFTAYHGWWNYTGGGTISFLNSDGTVLFGYTYDNNQTKVTNVTIGGATVSDFVAFSCQSAFNSNGSANGFTGSNKPYITTAGANPVITVTISQSGYVTFNIKVTNPKSGNVDQTFETQMASNVKTDLARITFASTDSRSGGDDRTLAINDLNIQSEISQVSYYAYTINYLYNNEIIKVTNGQDEANAVINAADPVTIDNVKYFIADNEVTSLTIGTDVTQNVLNVNLRKAGVKTVNINAVDGDNNILKTFSSTRVEGDAAANLYYTRAVKYDGKYYTTPRTADYFAKSMSYNSVNENVTYTLDESIVYYAETEDANKTGDFSITGANSERASGGDWRRAGKSSYAYTDQLQPGIYTIEIYGRNQSSSAAADLSLQIFDGNTLSDTEKTFTIAKAATADVTIEGVELNSAASFAIVNTSADYVSNIALDYIIVYKTGDLAESITITASGYASYVTTNALDFSGVEGLTAYKATAKDVDKVMLEEVTEVPAETPIIVKGTAGTTYNIPVGTCTTELTGNLFQGSTTTGYTVADGETVYALRASTGKMHPVTEGVTIPAKKAYLKLPAGFNAKALSFGFVDEEEATAITTATADTLEKATKFFNAAGQQVSKNFNGMVIDENGNKYIK